MSRARERAGIGGGLRALRDAWAVLGVALLLVALVEAGYRLGVEGRGGGRYERPLHPYHDVDWYRDFVEARERAYFGGGVDFDPYRGWWPRAIHQPGLNVDSLGRRRTVTPPGALDPQRRVLLLGGSVMWGYTVRDEYTIGSYLAARLAAAGMRDVEVVNLAQIAFNLTQGIASFSLELRNGAAPDAAVFLDGLNEISPLLLGRQPGQILHQEGAQERFESWEDPVAWLGAASRLLHVLEPLRERRRSATAQADARQACEEIALQYRNLVRIGAALGREFGVETLFFWQPTLATSDKPLGPFERRLLGEGLDERNRRLVALTRRCTERALEALRDREGRSFFSLTGLYDDVPEDVFIDHYGHVTETANETIAARISELLVPRLRAGAATSGSAAEVD